MSREDRRLLKFSVGAMAFVFVALWVVGELMMLAHPLSEADKKCMSKSMLELDQCLTDFAKDKKANG